jgi:hypothetical protein
MDFKVFTLQGHPLNLSYSRNDNFPPHSNNANGFWLKAREGNGNPFLLLS